jgi:hypothetical protein
VQRLGFLARADSHATFFIDPTADHPLRIKRFGAEEYFDMERFTSARGLDLIKR